MIENRHGRIRNEVTENRHGLKKWIENRHEERWIGRPCEPSESRAIKTCSY